MSNINLGEDTFSIIRQFQDIIVGCESCNALWMPRAKVVATQLSKEDFWQLSNALVAINKEGSTPSDLYAADVRRITHSRCPRCAANDQSFAKKIKAKQLAEGNFDCFGSAKHGYCDRFDCNRRLLCVHDEANPPSTLGFFQRLYHEVQHHLIAN